MGAQMEAQIGVWKGSKRGPKGGQKGRNTTYARGLPGDWVKGLNWSTSLQKRPFGVRRVPTLGGSNRGPFGAYLGPIWGPGLGPWLEGYTPSDGDTLV